MHMYFCFLYDIDIVEEAMIGELAKTSVRKLSNIVRLLHYISHFCKVSNINAFFKRHHCHSCDHFIGRAPHLERYLTVCKERVKHVFQKNVYQLRETVLDKFDSSGIHFSNDQKLFENLIIFNFETLCVQETNCTIVILQLELAGKFQLLYENHAFWFNNQSFYTNPMPKSWVGYSWVIFMG